MINFMRGITKFLVGFSEGLSKRGDVPRDHAQRPGGEKPWELKIQGEEVPRQAANPPPIKSTQ